MGVVDDFVNEYERQFDFWEASARAAHGLLETELDSSGLRAIVTSRAKSVDRLTGKLRMRDSEKSYVSSAEIDKDIPDRAGVRVALYFPGQTDEVEQIIKKMFDIHMVKYFPSMDPSDRGEADVSTTSNSSSHQQRFSGYGARHFRVRIPESSLNAGQERYSSALIEIQVASVLMHAWSEVEHDLVYKPLAGALSPSEHALLDQLNGLVLAGEIALEQLQQAGDARLAAAKTPFRSHYELAEFLRTRLSALGTDLTEATLGNVDILFAFLAKEESATASAVETYLDSLGRDFEQRPVAAQLADLMLSGNESRYEAYLTATSMSRHSSNRRQMAIDSVVINSPEEIARGEFIAAWIVLEIELKRIAMFDSKKRPTLPALITHLQDLGLISQEQVRELYSLRELRNKVVHGSSSDVDAERLSGAAAKLRAFTKDILLMASDSSDNVDDMGPSN